MNYELKDKISVNPALLDELAAKGWQEIEHLQVQIANIANTSAEAAKVSQILKNLLTSYYVFTGSIEAVANGQVDIITDTEPYIAAEDAPEEPSSDNDSELASVEVNTEETLPEMEISEPFEYFVDFDEPIGDPLSDEDLYNS